MLEICKTQFQQKSENYFMWDRYQEIVSTYFTVSYKNGWCQGYSDGIQKAMKEMLPRSEYGDGLQK